SNGIAAAPLGQFLVIGRDIANNPNACAVISRSRHTCSLRDWSSDVCSSDLTVDCVHTTVSKVAAADGSVHFTILGGSNGAGNAVTLLNGGRIFKNGTLIQSPTVSAFDLDRKSVV